MAEPVTYALRVRGGAVDLGGGRYRAECRAGGCLFTSALGPDRVAARPDSFGGCQAVGRRELRVSDDGSFVCAGEISFGAGAALTFRAIGRLDDSPDPELGHGTALDEVTGGRGRLALATGSVASQFPLAGGGERTDHHLGLLFVSRRA